MMPCYFIGTLSQTLTLRAAFASSTYLLSQIPEPGRSSDDDLLNSPDPLFKGAIRACGLSIAAEPALLASSGPASDDLSFVRTRARGHRFAVLRPASDDACYFIGTLSQTLTLRAAFTSSTYLLSQIPGPGRSSDDDLLNPPPSPLFKGRSGPTGFPSPLGFSARQLRPGI